MSVNKANKKGSEFPEITIIIPVYCIGEFLEESLETITKYPIQNIQYIFISKGISQEEEDFVARFSEMNLNKFLHVIHEEGGILSSLRKVFPYMATEYVLFIDGETAITTSAFHDFYSLILQNESEPRSDCITFVDFSVKGLKHIEIHTDKSTREFSQFRIIFPWSQKYLHELCENRL